MTELFAGLQEAGPVRSAVSDRAWLQALLDVEVALAYALADCGLAAAAEAALIEGQADASTYDVAALGAAATGTGNPVVPLVDELRRRLPEPAASLVHHGATSQDVMDTAAMLVSRAAVDAVLTDLARAADRLATLAEEHVDTLQAGRTLLQRAAPTTFGLTAAGWLAGLLRAYAAVRSAHGELAVQYGGAVGTLAVLDTDGPRVASALAARLGLADPVVPWHTERSRITGLAGALGQTCGAVAGVARSITLLAQSEVGELAEVGPPGSGGSSTMPHKRNPVAAVLAVSAAAQAPGLVATLLTAAGQEYQRAAGAWHAEWRTLRELLLATGSAVSWLATSLDRLQVDADRMRATAEAARADLTAERLALALTPELGRAAAAVAVGSGDVALPADERERLSDPSTYLGAKAEFVERVLAVHRRERTT